MKDKKLIFMEWRECEKEFIRHIEADKEKIKSILKLVKARINFIKSITPDKDNVSFVVENYYESIKELLVALLLKNGLRSNNHQCLISYFYKNYPNYEYEANVILQMSYVRNRLEYYGEPIDFEFYNKHKEDFLIIINILENLGSK
ncbi:MAG: hypothetical protein AABW56_04815 [Nanoarchaeota archaeon]